MNFTMTRFEFYDFLSKFRCILVLRPKRTWSDRLGTSRSVLLVFNGPPRAAPRTRRARRAVDFAPSRIYGAISASFITNNWLHGSRQYVNVEEPVVFSPFLVKTEREQKVVLAVYAIAKFKRRKRPPNRTQKREGYVYDDVACGMQ